MVKRNPFPLYFALIPLVVIQMQGLAEGPGAAKAPSLNTQDSLPEI